MFILPIVIPLFGLALVGWGLARSQRLLAPGWQKGVNDLTAKVLLPCVLFTGMYSHGLPEQHTWALLLSFYLPLVCLFWGLFFALRYVKGRSQLAFAGSFSNLVFIGLPVVVNLFGDKGLQYLFPIVAFHALTIFSMYYLSEAWDNRVQGQWLPALLKSVKNPIIIGLISGLIANLIHLPLPQVLLKILQMGARAALPCALIVMGASLAGISFKMAKWQMLLILVSKLLLLPLFVLLTSHFLFDLPLFITRVLVVMACCPVGINVYVVVRANGGDAQTVSSAILLSCWGSLLAWPFWLWVVHGLGAVSLG